MDEIVAWVKFASVTLMIGGLLDWFSGNNDNAEDADFVEANDTVLNALSDADATRTTEAVTGKNWREQLTVEEAMELHRERELRSMEDRN